MKPADVRDEWETPPELFARLVHEFGTFDLDPAATADNTLARHYFTHDGLERIWWGRVFLNPPYSSWRKWVVKARHEILRRGGPTLIVALLPADTSTKAFHRYIWGRADVRFLPSRQRFFYKGKPGPYPARFASMVVVWRRT